MIPTVTFTYAWSRPYLPADGTEKVQLIIEAQGAASGQPASEKVKDPVAHDMQASDLFREELNSRQAIAARKVKLTLQPSDYIRFDAVSGLAAEDIFGEKIIHAGDIYHKEYKTVLVELEIMPHRTGTHPVMLLEMEYKNGVCGSSSSFTLEVTAEFTRDSKLLDLPPHAGLDHRIQALRQAGTIGRRLFEDGAIERTDAFPTVLLPSAGGRVTEAGTIIRF
ncbi:MULTISPECIES: hypothetical protein [unclassified Paenibacillus]|uniref:hypothetical protein n=1 Tax=unclassified Paenibacillus TaxID=185978 RepID=UPI0009540A94|nr:MULTISPECIES: hypothetical protein [unclassified Paenibacillus]ASS66950.1 hypothetical protein CIC07_12995 [Paenibacillus sp. RUD330]SIR51228.1 hypothetical protein SAMN05880555_4062 [Paenibacillus sp. RU4X]SIR60163.1 hypothetical protein SAMN05880570_4064 [Paenibacillus sp. RU4T]